MPQPKHTPQAAADALIGVAPMLTRWLERLLANLEPKLTLAQYLTLRAVASGADSSAALARLAGVSGPAVSQLLSGLSDAGLVIRADLESDRRRATVTLTAHGTQVLGAVNSALQGEVSAVLCELPGPEVDALVRALPYVQAVLAGVSPPRRPVPGRPPGRPPGPHPGRPAGPHRGGPRPH